MNHCKERKNLVIYILHSFIDKYRVLSHIQDFGDAATSLMRDAAPTLGRCGHLSLEM